MEASTQERVSGNSNQSALEQQQQEQLVSKSRFLNPLFSKKESGLFKEVTESRAGTSEVQVNWEHLVTLKSKETMFKQ